MSQALPTRYVVGSRCSVMHRTTTSAFGEFLEIDAGRNRLIVAARDGLPPAAVMLQTLQARASRFATKDRLRTVNVD